MCALDESWNVGDHEAGLLGLISDNHDTEVRLEGSERIVGNLRPRRRDA